MKRTLFAIAVSVVSLPAFAQTIAEVMSRGAGRAPENVGEQRFSRTYAGDYRPLGTVAVIQGLITKQGTDARGNLSARLDEIDGKPVENGNLAYELLPGKHAVKVSCQGTDGVRVAVAFNIFAKADYFYEALSWPAERSCGLMLRDGGRLHPGLTGVALPPGEPALTSTTYYSVFERESVRHDEIWRDVTSAMHKFTVEKYGCDTYAIRKLVPKFLSGRIQQDPGSNELKIIGDFREWWTIEACGESHRLQLRLMQQGNYGRYVFIKD
jgi:hypothetical protein